MAFRKYEDSHHEQQRQYMKTYYLEHRKLKNRTPKGRAATRRDWNRRHPNYFKDYKRKHKMDYLMHNIITKMLRSANTRKYTRQRQYIGCSAGFLRGWLEAQFQPGMTWENYGTVWNVDHVVPLKWWDVEHFPQHLVEASHYTNLQPMFKSKNFAKRDRFAG